MHAASTRPRQWRPRSSSCCRQKRHDDAAGFAVSGRRRACVNAVASAFLLTFAGLFPIVNPLEAAPSFSLYCEPARRGAAAAGAQGGHQRLRAAVGIHGPGPWLLEFFGIELPVVRIAGGLVVAALGWKLLTQEQWSDHAGSAGLQGDRERGRQLLSAHHAAHVGPGSMSVAITIGSRKPAGIRGSRSSRAPQAARCSGGGDRGHDLSGVPLRREHRPAAGETGLEVLVRLSAFILMCIGIEIV